MNFLLFERLSKNAKLPIKATPAAVGFDLHSAYDYIIPKNGKALILTDISITLPNGCYGRIAPRSGLALAYSINVLAGVIDPDYKGNVGILLFNHGEKDFYVKQGDRVAQLILEKFKCHVEVLEIYRNNTLNHVGVGGFGSSGINEDINDVDRDGNSKYK